MSKKRLNRSSLPEVRAEWEKSLELVVLIPVKIDGYPVVFAILKTRQDTYRLHRYFPIGAIWDCSVDVPHGTLNDCCYKFQHSRDVLDLYREIENL